LDDEKIKFDQAPVIVEGNTLVQFRPLFEKMGLQISWDAGSQTISGIKDGNELILQIGNTRAWLNRTEFSLPAVPKIVRSEAYFVFAMSKEFVLTC